MSLQDSAYDFLQPNAKQIEGMHRLRAAARTYGHILATELPDGPDKTFVLRSLRSVAMWANVALTRHPDGTPRE